VKHGITVVESEDDADAVLRESGVVQSSNDQYGQNHYRIQGGVRLVNRDGKIIWADDINSGKFSESASTGFAENVAKSVAKALNAKQVPK
jgi:hypothetical protein